MNPDQLRNEGKEAKEGRHNKAPVGARNFWFTKDLSWKLQIKKLDCRVDPKNLSPETYVLSQCTSYQQLPKQCKGCLAVLCENLRWEAIVIWKVQDASLEFFRFRNNIELYPIKETSSI